MVTERSTCVVLSHASDTFQDTDGGGLEAGDGVAIHEEDLDREVVEDEEDGPQFDQPATVEVDRDTQIELESLLSPPVAKGDDFSLDDLLAESLETIAESAAVKANRKKLKDTRLSKGERLAIEAKIREWELAREWTPKAQVAMFNKQICNCGSIHSTFAGFFQRQQHRVSAIQRWVPAEGAALSDTGLPKENKTHAQRVALCADCADMQGYGDCTDMNWADVQHTIRHQPRGPQ